MKNEASETGVDLGADSALNGRNPRGRHRTAGSRRLCYTGDVCGRRADCREQLHRGSAKQSFLFFPARLRKTHTRTQRIFEEPTDPRQQEEVFKSADSVSGVWFRLLGHALRSGVILTLTWVVIL